MNIIYKEAKEKDAYGISYVSAYSWYETYKELLPREYLINRINKIDEKEISTKKFIKNYSGKYIVAKFANKIVGILAYRKIDNGEYKDYGYIEALYVLKKYQKQGIGRELFKRALVGLKEMGFKKIMLECMEGNGTINFYKKYNCIIDKTIDYKINENIIVKANVILYNDINSVLKVLNK